MTWLELKSWKQIFWTGWWAQFVLTLIGFNWVALTVHEFGHLPWVLAAGTLFLFCSLANVYLPLAGVAWFFFCRRLQLGPLARLAALPVMVCVFERLTPQIFDWHFGYTWLWAGLPGMHLADIVGFAGLSSIGILANGFLLLAWWRFKQNQPWWPVALVTPALFVALNLFGYIHGQGRGLSDRKLRVLLVQANIGNQEKLAAEKGSAYRNVVIDRFAEATRRGLAAQGPADYVVWPETAFSGGDRRPQIGARLPPPS